MNCAEALRFLSRASGERSLNISLRQLFRYGLQGVSLPVTQAIAERWGIIDGQRQAAGRPLGVADGMIAATALEHGLTLVTRNVKDFMGLSVTIVNPWERI